MKTADTVYPEMKYSRMASRKQRMDKIRKADFIHLLLCLPAITQRALIAR
jgi:hypothetical protein